MSLGKQSWPLPSATDVDWKFAPLERGLREARDKLDTKGLSAEEASALRHRLILQVVPEVHFVVVKRLMYTAAAAGFSDVNLTVIP
jgi:hypothetical protein